MQKHISKILKAGISADLFQNFQNKIHIPRLSQMIPAYPSNQTWPLSQILPANPSSTLVAPLKALLGDSLRSHRTGRTTQEVEQWTDPEQDAKEVPWEFPSASGKLRWDKMGRYLGRYMFM